MARANVFLAVLSSAGGSRKGWEPRVDSPETGVVSATGARGGELVRKDAIGSALVAARGPGWSVEARAIGGADRSGVSAEVRTSREGASEPIGSVPTGRSAFGRASCVPSGTGDLGTLALARSSAFEPGRSSPGREGSGRGAVSSNRAGVAVAPGWPASIVDSGVSGADAAAACCDGMARAGAGVGSDASTVDCGTVAGRRSMRPIGAAAARSRREATAVGVAASSGGADEGIGRRVGGMGGFPATSGGS